MDEALEEVRSAVKETADNYDLTSVEIVSLLLKVTADYRDAAFDDLTEN